MRNLVLILGQCEPARREYEAALGPLGFSTICCDSYETLAARSCRSKPVAIILESQTPQEALSQTRDLIRLVPRAAVLLLAPDGGESFAASAWEAGVSGLFYLPVSPHVVAYGLRRAACPAEAADSRLIGVCREIRRTRELLAKVAQSDCNVMITGETGTGKELAAESIHASSSRRGRPFQCVNCAAIPDSLLESELFGYERGAFTGAHSRFIGQLQAADGGTLFLDEIGEMSLFAQAKILRAIETRNIQPLGSHRSTVVNLRVIAATNRNLEYLVSQGKFRDDLFFRLKVAQIRMAPLRERQEDIPLLAHYFVRQYNSIYRTTVRGFTEHALACLTAYPWTGNVRELKNLIEGVFVMQPGDWITLEDLPPHVRVYSARRAPTGSEREQLRGVLDAVNWNKSEAAAKLSWSRMTVYRKIAKYNIKP